MVKRQSTPSSSIPVVVGVLLVLLLTAPHPRSADALVSPSTTTVTSSTQSSSWRRVGAALVLLQQSSTPQDDNNDPNQDDEISKLIGRRSQIKRKKKQDDANEAAAAALPPNNETLVDLDLDKLPEFKTERPVRRAKSSENEDSQNEEEDNNNNSKNDVPIVDFQAEYDDENELHICNRLIASTRSWGDEQRNFVAAGKLTKRMIKEGKFVPGDLQLAHEQLLERGILTVETSPSYGAALRSKKLSAEWILKRCLDEAPTDLLPETVVVETVSQPSWRAGVPPRRLTQQLYDSVETLGTSTVELFQVRCSPLYPTRFVASALSTAIESGCCNHVGVQGVHGRGKLARLCRRLEAQDMSLTSNAFEFSLTNRQRESLLDVCKDFNVIPLVLNPLDNGLASGVYTATNPSGGRATTSGRPQFTFPELERWQPLHSVQETVAERVATRVKRSLRDLQDRFRPRYGPPPQINTDITTTQVALNYVIAKGGVPVVEVNSPKDAQELAGSLGWGLTEEEVEMLDNAAALCKL